MRNLLSPATLLCFSLCVAGSVSANAGGVPAQITALQADIAALKATVAALRAQVQGLSSGPSANPVQVYGPPAPARVTSQLPVPFVVSVTNAGASTLYVTAINYALSSFDLGYYFFHYDGMVDGKTISANPCSSFLTVLAPGAGCDVVMTFESFGGTGTITGGIEVPTFSAGDSINRTGFVPVTQVVQ